MTNVTREQLQSIEWAGFGRSCPACGSVPPHAEDCWLLAALRAPVVPSRAEPQSADDVLFMLGEAAGPGQEPTIEMAREIWALMDGETRFTIAVRAWERGKAVAELRAPAPSVQIPTKPASPTCEACEQGFRLASDGVHYDDARGGWTWGVCRKVVAALRAPVAPAEMPEIMVGDWVQTRRGVVVVKSDAELAALWGKVAREIRRDPLWRREGR